MPYIYSGVCLAAMFGSIIYEHRRLKREETKLRETMKSLAEQAKGENTRPTVPSALQAIGLV
ncbi:hypothetical protein C4J81_04120 [Deltaproteobacteria bacterium Smac51]|nr:hypothetical protein C4J81_04120 [Deltaproteobacteria bacterium Smac51]